MEEHIPVDSLRIIGLGVNGHVGFNEPGDEKETRSHFHSLDETTVVVGSKYFKQQEAPKQGITLGLHDLLCAKNILLEVTGAHKAPVVKAMLDGPVSVNCPASFLRETEACVHLAQV